MSDTKQHPRETPAPRLSSTDAEAVARYLNERWPILGNGEGDAFYTLCDDIERAFAACVSPAPTPTRAAVEQAVNEYGEACTDYARDDFDGDEERMTVAYKALLALFDAAPRGEAVARPVNFCSTCGKDVRGLRDVDGVHTCHNPRDAR